MDTIKGYGISLRHCFCAQGDFGEYRANVWLYPHRAPSERYVLELLKDGKSRGISYFGQYKEYIAIRDAVNSVLGMMKDDSLEQACGMRMFTHEEDGDNCSGGAMNALR